MAEPRDVMAYLEEADPDLAKRIAPLFIQNGARVICETYGIEEPQPTDKMGAALDYILEEMRLYHAKSNDEE